MSASVRWHPEEHRGPDGTVRQLQAAWLVACVAGTAGRPAQQRYLAYLGVRPRVTPELACECQVLYPEIEIDWDRVREAVRHPPPVAPLSLDELALHRTEAALAQRYQPADVEYRIGRGLRRPLTELRTLLADPATVARLERTSGSVIRYLVDFHPEYAYAVGKLWLLLDGSNEELGRLEAEEPRPGRGVSRADQLRFWRRGIRRVQESA